MGGNKELPIFVTEACELIARLKIRIEDYKAACEAKQEIIEAQAAQIAQLEEEHW